MGIDLAGASSAATGIAEIQVTQCATVITRLGVIERAKSPREAERRLNDTLADLKPGDVVAIDAPLTLPPGLRLDPSAVSWDAPDGAAAPLIREMWAADWNPLVARECEYLLVKEHGLPRPAPTMRLGMLIPRAIWIARELRARGITVIETYPRAVRTRLDTQRPGRGWSSSYDDLAEAIRMTVAAAATADIGHATPDALDAVLCAIVALVFAEGQTIDPPPGLDEVRDGWIRIPAPFAAAWPSG